jgi:hypothetical protein
MIISLVAFAWVDRDCFSFSGHSLYVIENTTNDTKADNSITAHSDSFEVDVTLTPGIYTFSLKNLSNNRVIISNFFFPKNLYFHIWQPPKVS